MKATKLRKTPLPSWQLVPLSARLVSQYSEQVLFLFLLPSLITLLGQLLLGSGNHLRHLSELGSRQHIGLICLLVGFLWTFINIGPGMYFRLKATAGDGPSTMESYRRGLRFNWRLLGLYIAIGLVLLIGLVALIIPGLLLLVLFVKRYYLTAYYIVGQDLAIKPALKKCQQDSEPVQPAIWGLVGVQVAGTFAVGLLGVLGIFGTLAGELINLALLFLAALRYQEIHTSSPSHGKITLAGKK